MIVPMFRALLASVGILLVTSCSAQNAVPDAPKIRLDETHLHSFDGDKLPYTRWMPREEPDLIIIGVHGISGAASDYRPLAKHILASFPKVAVYGAETRGQGNDPVKERRGNIGNRKDWFKDLTSFTSLIRKKHPKAKIVWCGESMGSLIILHAYAYSEDRKNLCDAMILASPITDIRGDFPRWKVSLVNVVATLLPKIRVSLESLSGEDEVRVTKDTVHTEQAATNSYHVKRHTLHLLTTLGDMILKSKEASQKLDIPLIVLYGGKDVFSDPKDVEAFVAGLPKEVPLTRKYYPESFHLLFHDHQSDKVIADIVSWIKAKPWN